MWIIGYYSGAHFIYFRQYEQARRPHYDGEEIFNGEVIHSCQFRRPEKYKGKTVLTIGGCTSGQDVTDQICQFAEKVSARK